MTSVTEERTGGRICSQEHIAYLLASAMEMQRRCLGNLGIEQEPAPPFNWNGAGGERRELTPETFRQTGQMLLDRNLRSWLEGQDPEPEQGLDGPRFRITWAAPRPWTRLEAVEAIRAAHGYAMNARGRGWKGSEARSFIRKVVRLATWNLPGYDRASLGEPHDLDRLMTMERENDGN